MKKTDNWKKAMEVRKNRKMKSLEPKKERTVSPITLKQIVRYVLKRVKDPDTTDMTITLEPRICLIGVYILVTVIISAYDRKEYVVWRRADEQKSVALSIETALKNNGVPVAVSERHDVLVICDLY